MNRELRIGETALTGRAQGIYNRETRKGEVKRGMSGNGNKYQVFEISVSSKEKDSDKWINGTPIKVMMFGEVKVEAGDNVGLVGNFRPDNWTDKEGKERRGLIFMCNAEDMFEPASWDKKAEAKPQAKEEPEVDRW